MMTEIDELRGRLLDWLYEQSRGNTSEGIEVEPFMAATGIDLVTALNLVRETAAYGLVIDCSGMGSPAAIVTIRGVREAQERQRLRADPTRRAAVARAGLLRWLYEQEQTNVGMPALVGVLTTDYATFLGARLTETEIDRAAKYLADKKFINGSQTAQSVGPARASLTSEGRDCVEHHGGDVSSYLKDKDNRSGQTYNIGTFNNAGAAAFGGGSAHHQSNVDPAVVATFVQMLVAQLPGLPMDSEHQIEIRTAVHDLQQELDRPGDSEVGRITRALGRVIDYVTDAGKPVLTALFLAFAQQYGLPTS